MLTTTVSAVQVAVTVRSTTPAHGLWFVNPVLTVHDGTYDAFDAGATASAAVESSAEDGNPSGLQTEFGVAQPHGLSAVIAGPVAPGRSYTQVFDLDPAIPAHRYLSYFSMIIPSNDGFFGNDNPTAYPLFDDSGYFIPRSIPVWGAAVWDAGTEVNDEVAANVAFLAQAAPNTGPTEGGTVGIHAGFKAAGLGGILDATSMAPGTPVTFGAADFKANGYQVAEITVSVINGASATPSRFVNLSARGPAGTGDNTKIVGFVVSPGADKPVLVRVAGPSLANFNVAGFLADPSVTVFDADGNAMGSNDNWVAAEVGDAVATVGAFAFDADSADAAVMLTLAPGAYTAHVGNPGTTDGVVLVEFYEVSN
ncbi:spondin domain-containing protein [Synoicihabitans lomoniglobus]|uniref:spondin domain-containing protein n=1 Tax=Synoicihabitans lomoniglobus TaxID=2909285 RepID=UPI002ED66F05|nr:spondin domain-containing protein [Opitutaceae bacterium LMO-M01]